MSAPSTILVTGGAGFLGSHTCVDLLDHGYEVIVVDHRSPALRQVLARVERLAGRFVGAVYELDIRDRRALSAVFARHPVDVVLHFAGLTSAQAALRDPVAYYDTNVGGTTALLHTMHEHGVHQLVFSSTCALYAPAVGRAHAEDDPVRPEDPYAASKWACEQVLADVCRHRPEYTVVCLRHFTPAGAHPSGLLGEERPAGQESLVPLLAQVAEGHRPHVPVYGGDYPTPDGTAVRDYVHVLDAVEAHRLALDHLAGARGLHVYNLGSGRGTSVLEVVGVFSRVCGRRLPYEIVPRRPGDTARRVADAGAVGRAWNWRPRHGLDDVCRDAWRFQHMQPLDSPDSLHEPGDGGRWTQSGPDDV
ncbi:UDP-glucose 4-epimerase GalE [Streptomyces sp. NPDC014806]|uniref:UDP-glucose 4-epimerase GalE n=1 Tax=Streptomyces sp. NPDC014806 TaxID=3364920 RepID=UPI003702C98C